MADDLDFESFDNLDDLDWSELEKDVKEGAADQAGAAPAAGGEPGAIVSGGNEAVISTDSHAIDIHYLLDVDLQVTVEVGRRLYFVSDILTWDPGSIIELDKVVGEPLNLLVNNKLVAKGEVVVVHDKFALKITEILDPQDRLQFLQN